MNPSLYSISREVQKAIRQGRPVVALESSVIAQGLPFPQNLEAAIECERVVRSTGAVPATVSVIDGRIVVGASEHELERLAQQDEKIVKIAARDLSAARVLALTGGTTVSATVEICSRIGIKVFSTGGIGGVHRGSSWDVSQDIWAIGKFPVAVVCAGVKAILDLVRTTELLESYSVPIIGVGTSSLPGFYSESTGLSLEYSIRDAREGAQWLYSRFDEMEQAGLVFAVPPPADVAIPSRVVERAIGRALRAARAKGIRGKDVTPFLLNRVSELTEGISLKTNISLLQNNARFAARLAFSYSQLSAVRSAPLR